jgi:hypothetical protein
MNNSEESDLFKVQAARGTCRVMCFHPKSNVSIPTMTIAEITAVVDKYACIFLTLMIKWVCSFICMDHFKFVRTGSSKQTFRAIPMCHIEDPLFNCIVPHKPLLKWFDPDDYNPDLLLNGPISQ